MRLRELELEEVHFEDEELREVLSMAEGSLEVLKVVKCTGYSGAGLVEVLKMHVARLRKLEVVVTEPKATRRPTPPPSPPPPSPPRSPTRSPTLSAPALFPTLTQSLDAALEYLPHLTHLSLSGSALVSPSTLASLSTTTPHLRSLSLSQHALIKPAHLLPLVRDGSTRLPHLQHLALHPPSPPADSDCLPSPSDDHDDPAVTDLWTACLASDVDLVGAPFSRVKERLEWATTEAARVAVAGCSSGGKGQRRKRPSLAV
ncbi:Transmembrane protein [Rhodotorula toruloides]|nr:Transmembrane protein [Rhodotorula toruloides]